MSLWLMIAVGVTLAGEPAAQAEVFVSKTTCEEFRAHFDEVMAERYSRGYESKCTELKMPEKA